MTYVEREALLAKCAYEQPWGADAVIAMIEDFPAADVQHVRHGRWKPYDLTYGRSIYYCTACNRSAVVPTALDEPIFNYCPNCGAKMDGGKT